MANIEPLENTYYTGAMARPRPHFGIFLRKQNIHFFWYDGRVPVKLRVQNTNPAADYATDLYILYLSSIVL